MPLPTADRWVWSLDPTNVFSTKSVFNKLSMNETRQQNLYSRIWKDKLPKKKLNSSAGNLVTMPRTFKTRCKRDFPIWPYFLAAATFALRRQKHKTTSLFPVTSLLAFGIGFSRLSDGKSPFIPPPFFPEHPAGWASLQE